jgi:response regulator RpfG family c-di-GMP phosphodiesterase
MTRPLQLLIVEDSPEDAELMVRELRHAGFDPQTRRVESEEAFLAALQTPPQIILMDYQLPAFNALRGLTILREKNLPLPCIIVSGMLDDETAVECVRLGASDYLLKDRLARLGSAVERAIHDRENSDEVVRAEQALQESEAQFLRIAEHAPDIIFRYRLGEKPGFLYLNPSVESITGFTPGEFSACPELWAQRIRAAESEPRSEAAGVDPTGNALMNLGPKVSFLRKDGSTAWLDQRVAVVRSPQGAPDAVEGIIRDITEAEQRERELAAIVAVAGALRTAPTREDILPIILQQITNLLKADGAAVVILDAATGAMKIQNASGVWADRAGSQLGEARLDPNSPVRPCAESADYLDGVQDVVCTPMSAQGQAIGALWAGRNSPINEEELRLLTAVADIAANALRRASLHEQTQRRLQHITALRAIDMAITSSLDLRVTLNFFLDQVTVRLGVHAASVLLLDAQTQMLQFVAGRGFRTQALQRTKLRLGDGVAGRAALERRMITLPDMEKHPDGFNRSPFLAGEGFISYFATPLIAKGQVKGVLEIFHRARMEPDVEWLEFLDTLAVQAAIAIDNAALFEDLQRSNLDLELAYDATIEGWSRTLDMRDRVKEGHSRRVTELSLGIAQAMGFSGAELVHIRRGALLHDIGNMGVPDQVLQKPGPLTEAERTAVQRHPEYAHELLGQVNYLRPALSIPYCHHEKWDGSGYPRGLRGDAIPVAARIFAVADVWDAMSSERPYRAALLEAEARAYVASQSGRHFDPQIVALFIRLLDEKQIGIGNQAPVAR